MMEEEEETLFDQEGLLSDKSSTRSERAERKRKIFKTAALTLAFFSLGCCVAIPGATLLDLGERVGKDTEHMTFIAMARSAGYLIGSVFGGIMADFFDPQLLIFYSLFFTSVATTLIPWCTMLFALAILIAIQGITLGVLDTGGNVYCIRIWGKKSPPYMQFLHFAFAIGAFLAPLIAHPFLLNSIEFSSHNSNQSNVSLKSVLPYASSDYLAREETKRDVSLHVNPMVDFDDLEHFQALSHFEYRREAVVPTGNTTNTQNRTGIVGNVTTAVNDSVIPAPPVESTTKRPKKPEVVYPLSIEHSDSHVDEAKLNGLKDPATSNEDNNKEKNGKEEYPSQTVVNVTTNGDSDVNNTLKRNASNSTSKAEMTNSTVLSSSSLSSTTVTTPSSTTHAASSTTSTSRSLSHVTTNSATTTMTTMSKEKTSKYSEKSQAEETSSSASVDNSTTFHNSTLKPDTWGDLVYDMLDTMRHMSKIQFAYLIIGLFLISNAGFFLSLYCKDKLSDSRLMVLSHDDLTRPPNSPCFVGTLLTLLFVFFLFYVGMEQTYGILLTTFAVDFPATIWSPAQGASLTAVFWGCVALGRGISICVSRFFKAPCMLVSNLALTLLGTILLSFALRSSWVIIWVGTILMGLGMSSLFPTTISWTDSYYPLTGKAAAVFVAGSGVGQMTIPVLTGYLYQNVDQMCLMYVVFALSILLCIIYTGLQVTATRKSNGTGIARSYSGFMRLHNSEDMADSLDMDLIQAGSMDRPVAAIPQENNSGTHGKENGVSGDYEDTEFSKLVELSD